ncbi:bile acid:sodium symporter family protein [Bacteroidota bacterium]
MSLDVLNTILLPLTLAITTLGMGLSLEKKDFQYIFWHPNAIITGLTAQMVLLPAIAFIIAYFSKLEPEFKVGLILIAACPGGATSNLINYIFRNNLALCLSITTINSFLVQFSLPLIVNIALGIFIGQTKDFELPFLDTVLQIFLITVIPTIIGIYIRAKFRDFAISMDKPLKIALPILLLVVFSVVIFKESNNPTTTLRNYVNIYPFALLLNLLAIIAGRNTSRLTRLKKNNQLTIAVEVGLQNSALAIFIASSLLENSMIAIVAVIYSSFSFFTTALYAWLAKRYW